MTPEAIVKLEHAFAIDATVEEACSYAEVSRDAFYDYLKKKPEFSDRIADLRNRPILKARQTIVQALSQPQHAEWYLTRKRKKEFAERIEQTGADGKDLNGDATEEIKLLTQKLNEVYRGTSRRSDGGSTSTLGNKAQDKD